MNCELLETKIKWIVDHINENHNFKTAWRKVVASTNHKDENHSTLDDKIIFIFI